MNNSIFVTTIPGRGVITDSIDIAGAPVVGIIMPSDWTPAVVTVQGSSNGVDFYDLYDGVTAKELSFNVKPNSMVAISPSRVCCCTSIKLRSGTSAKPVPQPISRHFTVIVQGDVPHPNPVEDIP